MNWDKILKGVALCCLGVVVLFILFDTQCVDRSNCSIVAISGNVSQVAGSGGDAYGSGTGGAGGSVEGITIHNTSGSAGVKENCYQIAGIFGVVAFLASLITVGEWVRNNFLKKGKGRK